MKTTQINEKEILALTDEDFCKKYKDCEMSYGDINVYNNVSCQLLEFKTSKNKLIGRMVIPSLDIIDVKIIRDGNFLMPKYSSKNSKTIEYLKKIIIRANFK